MVTPVKAGTYHAVNTALTVQAKSSLSQLSQPKTGTYFVTVECKRSGCDEGAAGDIAVCH